LIMIQAFSAISTCQDGFEAGREVAQTAMAKLSGKPDMLWVFASVAYNQQRLLDGIASVAPGIQIIGCTTDGEIFTAGLSVNSVVMMAMVSDRIRFHTSFVEQLSKDSYVAGVELGVSFQGLNCRYIQIFSDGLSGNADKIIQGIKSSLGDDIKIAGGTAGDSGEFKRTYQYFRDRVLTDSIVGVAFEGDFALGTGTACGWFPVGIAKKVTRSVGNIVYELDGQPALQAYEKYLGKHAELLPAVGVEYPLGLLGLNGDVIDDSYFLCRATMGVDRPSGAIVFAGDVPEGASVKMTIGNERDIIQAAGHAAQSAMSKLQGSNPDLKPKAIFLYSCMARKIVLGSKTNEEILAIQDVIGRDVPVIGFYTYGEYAPIGKLDHSCFHNETATMTVIGD
jgi:hypothetical protein